MTGAAPVFAQANALAIAPAKTHNAHDDLAASSHIPHVAP
jgi:hypothetical protein